MAERAIQELLQARARIDSALSELGYEDATPFGAFGEIIARRRKELDLSLQAVADRCGVAKGHLWDMEQGNAKNPTLETVWLLSKALHLRPAEVVAAACPDPHPTEARDA